MNNQLISFFEHNSIDSNNRRIGDIWKFSNYELENVHDYIQWLFPLYQSSRFNMFSPLLDDETVYHIRDCEVCKESFIHSVKLMRRFYSSTTGWMKEYDHNMMRISRILKSIALLQSKQEATYFYMDIVGLCNCNFFIPDGKSLNFWNDAIS